MKTPHIVPRIFVLFLLFASCFSNLHALSVGDRVKVAISAGVKIRDKASTSGTELKPAVPQGQLGTILSGPTPADGYSWWRVDWDSSSYSTGWSAEGTGSEVWLQKFTTDTTAPIVTAFSVTPSALTQGNPVTISYSATDSGGSGLSKVELWRAPGGSSAPTTGWILVSSKTATGSSTSNSFTDTPPTGTFWYGVTVYDGQGNQGLVVTNGLGPKKVIVSAPADTTVPTVTAFSVTPSSLTQGGQVAIDYSVYDNTSLNRVELWRTPDSGGSPSSSGWAQIGTSQSASGTSKTGSFSDAPPVGVFWYGLHVVDGAGNLGKEDATGKGPKKVTVSAVVSKGSATLTVRDSNGSTLANSEINGVLLGKQGGGEINRKEPPSGNPMTFSSIDYGSYYFMVFCWDMYAGSANFSLGASSTSVSVTTYAKRPLKIKVVCSDGFTVPSTSGLGVILESYNSANGTWTNRAFGTTAADGTYTFSAWPTTSTGEKYRVKIQTTSNLQIGILDPVTVSNTTSGSSYTITTTLAPPPITGNLSVTLKDANGLNAPTSSSPATPEIILYTSPQKTVSGTNPASFSSVTAGTYWVEAYHNGTFWGKEFWNSEQKQIVGNASNALTLTRKYPRATKVEMYDNATNQMIWPGQSVAAGRTVRFEVTVKNDVPNQGLSTQVGFALDYNRDSSFDYDSGLSTAQVITSSGGQKTFSFPVTLNGRGTGQLYFALEVKTTIQTTTGTEVRRTDSWGWTQAMVVSRAILLSGIVSKGLLGVSYPVTIERYPVSSKEKIDPNMVTWLIVHGRVNSSRSAWVTTLAGHILKQYPTHQVLLLDWSDAASDDFSPLIAEYLSKGEDWIQPVANWSAQVLKDYGFTGSQINLIGHSWGGNLCAELAERMPSSRVNSIVALDPARNGAGAYDPSDSNSNNGLREIDFKRNSNSSWVFRSSTLLGNKDTPETAAEAFAVYTLQSDWTWNDIVKFGNSIDAHGLVTDIFNDILAHPTTDLGKIFTLDRLVNSNPSARPWVKDQYKWDGDVAYGFDKKVYEATILADESGKRAWALYYKTQAGALDSQDEIVRHDTSSPTTYKITSSAGISGVINPALPMPVGAGGNVSFIATPDSGYIVDQWLVNGGVVQVGGNNYNVANIYADKTVQVTFKAVGANNYTLNIVANNGSVAKNPNQAFYSAGSSVVLTAMPASGYKFTGWSGDTSGTQNPLSLPMNANKIISANFIPTTPQTPTRILSLAGVMSFGSVAVGSSAGATLTITNDGNSVLNVSGVTYPIGFSGSWSGSIAAGESRAVPVIFAPTSGGSYGGPITVNSDKTSGTNTISCSGTGTVSKAAMTAPASGSTLTGSTQTFSWSAGSGGQEYWLQVGSALGGSHYSPNYSAGKLLSQTVSGLPTNGSTVYVRLWTMFSGVWGSNYIDYTYTAATVSTFGALTGTINPAGAVTAGAQWQVDGGSWQNNGATVSSLGAGSHTVAFKTVSGYTTPANQTITVNANQTSSVSGAYIVAATPTKAAMTAPTNNSTLLAASTTFSWSAGSGALEYWLDVGNAPGGVGFFSGTVNTSLSKAVSGLPTNGSKVYVRLWTRFASGWGTNYNDYTYTAATVSTFGAMTGTISPAGAVSSGAQWQVDGGSWQSSGATVSSLGAGSHTVAFKTVSGYTTPANQTITVNANQTSSVSGAYIAAATPTKAAMTAPTNNGTLPAASTTFSWSAGSGALEYWLDVGNTPGGVGIFSGTVGTSLSKSISGLPTNGTSVYVRLWTRFASGWGTNYSDYTYTATTLGQSSTKAAMTSPVSGSTLAGSSQTFSWSAGTGALEYWLDIGPGAGGAGFFSGTVGTSLSKAISGLPTNGTPVYVRLWTRFASGWGTNYTDYTYKASSAAAPTPTPSPTILLSDNFNDNLVDPAKWTCSGNIVSESNQQMQVLTTVTDAGGNLSTLPISVNGTGILTISRKVFLHSANNYYSSFINVQIGSLPKFGIHYENYDYSGPYDLVRHGFYIMRNNSNSHGPESQGDTSAVIKPVWDAWFSETITYNPVSGVLEFFLNNVSQMTYNVGVLPQGDSPTMTLSFNAWGWWTGHQHLFDDILVTQGSSGAPTQTKAAMIAPVGGSTLAGAAQTFNWSPGSGGLEYWLDVGNTPGGVGFFSGTVGTSLSKVVSGLPTNGSTVYARLWTRITSGWGTNYTDYTYTAATLGQSNTKAAMTAPVGGNTLAGNTQTFTWNAGSGGLEYWLQVGSSPGGGNYYNQSTGTSLSKAVSGLPANGSPVYVRLWTRFAGGWGTTSTNYTDYTYTSAFAP